MDEYLLRNCDTGRIQPAGEEAILEKVLERGGGRGRGTRPGSSPSYRPGAGVPAQLRIARLLERQQASAVINYNSRKVGGVVW